MRPNPMPRQSRLRGWTHGVLQGGVIIDMLECLSRTTLSTDYELVLWLQAHYIERFGRVERLDGIVVTEEKHIEVLYRAYERYVEVKGDSTRAQRLWVPGLEPTYQSYTTGHETIPDLPRRCAYKPWIGSEMYYKHGIEVKRSGKFEGKWTDEKKWERLLWSALDPNHLATEQQKPVVEPGEHLPSRPIDVKNPSYLNDSGGVPANSCTAHLSGSPGSLLPGPDGASSPPTLAAKSNVGLTNMSRSQTSGEASSPHSSILRRDYVRTSLSRAQTLEEASSPDSTILKSHPEA